MDAYIAKEAAMSRPDINRSIVGRSSDSFRFYQATERLYRTVFLLAVLYNLGFGLWVILFPNAFFDLVDITRPTYSAIWGSLGMVGGVYAILYAYGAKHLERAVPIIAWD